MSAAIANPEEIARQTGITHVRPGGPEDAVLDVVPAAVVYAGSVEEVSRLLAWANEHRLKVAPCGTRTKLDRGAAPLRCDLLLDLSGLAGVVEHAAGDLTVTVRAGTRLEDLQRVLAEAGQTLALDPPVPGTIGGLVATNSSGPRRLRYGGVRDLILGVRFVRADGTPAKGGGKVVKNVAGYDLPKLFTGSLGTLGVLVEATFRLYPLPAASATAICEDLSVREAGEAADRILHSTLVPTSLDYFAGPGGTGATVAVRFESSQRSVEAQAARAAALLGEGSATAAGKTHILADSEEASLWERFRNIMDTDQRDVLAQVIAAPMDLPPLLDAAQQESARAGAGLTVRAHLGHGHALLRWHNPPPETAAGLLRTARRQAEARDGNLVVWRAPAEVRAQVDPWGHPGEGLELMRRVKAQFDPNNTLNPGRFLGGI